MDDDPHYPRTGVFVSTKSVNPSESPFGGIPEGTGLYFERRSVPWSP